MDLNLIIDLIILIVIFDNKIYQSKIKHTLIYMF